MAMRAETTYRTRIFTVKKLDMRVRGRHYPWHYLTGPNAVVVLPLVDSNRVLIEKQYRFALGKYIYEFPAGGIKKGERPGHAARRELEEETGYRAGGLKLMFRGYTAPAWHTEVVHYYLATDLKRTRTRLDPTERIDLEVVKLSDVLDKKLKGGILDTKSLALALFYRYRIQGRH